MSEQNDDLEYEDDSNSQQDSPKGLRDALKRAQAEAKANAGAAEELAKVKRESAFRDVGLDPKKPNHQDFIKAYDGDLSEQAIREAAETRGYLEPPAPEVPSNELAALERMSGASVGSQPAYQGDGQAFMDALNNAKSKEEVLAAIQTQGYLSTFQ